MTADLNHLSDSAQKNNVHKRNIKWSSYMRVYMDTNFLVTLRPSLGRALVEPPRKYDCLPYPEFSDHSWLRLWQWHVYVHRIPQSSRDHGLLSGVGMRDREGDLIQTKLCFRSPSIDRLMPRCWMTYAAQNNQLSPTVNNQDQHTSNYNLVAI